MTASTLHRPTSPTTTTSTPAPQARRLRPPSWRDPRLLVGLLLVLGSTVGGAVLLRSADDTVAVYTARHALVAGQALTPGDLAVEHVRLSGDAARYLSATVEPGATVVLRAVGEGELVPASAVGEATASGLRPVAVPAEGSTAQALGPGALVDVWVASRSASRADGYERPRLVATGVQVAQRTSGRTTWGAAPTSTVEVMLSPDLVPVVIEAVDNAARVTLVPVPGSTPTGGGRR